VEGAWCRYLCPYGALLGLASWFSPTKITRQAETCVDCHLCDKACPARLMVSQMDVVNSPECTGCLDCVAVCPKENTLDLTTFRRRRVSPLATAAAILGLFLAGYAGAQVTGIWANEISDEAYVNHVSRIHSAQYGHPGS
jgi:polyferredoxin